MAFLVSSQATESDPGSPATHPLDPLSAAEIESAAEAVKVKQGLGRSARFVYISLYEPAKADVIAFEQAGRPRPAWLRSWSGNGPKRATYEGIVGLLAPLARGGPPPRAPPANSLKAKSSPGKRSPACSRR